jgi:nitrite reductase/ring-hydroxylating ferredoxin subunit
MGAGWGLIQVATTAQDGFGTGILRLRLSDYPALQEDFGSIRIGTSTQFGSFPAGLYYPVIINRAPGGVFHALNSRCPHEGCTVAALDPEVLKMNCPCHFSQFGVDGSYITGPANGPLTRYKTTLINGFLLVEIPDLPFTLTVERGSVRKDRMAIEFLAFTEITYEVHFRGSLQEVPSPISFALTETGEFNQTALPGNDDLARVFVPILNGNSGIYSVGMKTQEV